MSKRQSLFKITRTFSALVLSALACCISSNSLAQATYDIGQSSDIPMLGRYPGSFISHYSTTDFGKATFPLSLNSRDNMKQFNKKIVEGDRTVIIYDIPQKNEKNIYKVYKSLEKSFNEKGFQAKISCDSDENRCGSFFPRMVFTSAASHKIYRHFKEFYNMDASNGALYIYAGTLQKDGEEYYLTSVIGQTKWSRFIQYSIDLVKVGDLETEDMVLNTQDLSSSINTQGKAELKGIYFENDSATLTSQSKASLTTITNFLTAHPNKKYYVVGHTDTEGSYSHNKSLSHDRAQAVMTALIENGVSKNNLRADGIAYLSPVQTNDNSEGREKNRRVELVEVEAF